MASNERVAIVGLAGRFPGSGSDLEKFWANIAAGKDTSREVPSDRWLLNPRDCHDPRVPHPDSVYSTRGYFLDPFQTDDSTMPNELLTQLDPLFHLVLDLGHRAWRSAKTDNLDKRNVGVILGNICLPTVAASTLADELLGGPLAASLGQEPPTKQVHRFNRYVAGLPAGLLAKSLQIGGGSFTLDAACASSLYAFKLACDELLSGRADAMLAGGVSRPDPLYTQMGFSQLRALSLRGRCSPFDQRADGLVVGEGGAIFILKRLSDALDAGDTIHAIIRAVGLSNDMHGNLLAPAQEGQLRAMQSAYMQAKWPPSFVDMIECHATGTPVGDGVEFRSLRQLWQDEEWQPGQCVIGSVKSTVGHLLTGAGAAAMMKTLLAIRHQTLPPQANFHMPHPELDYEKSPFRVLEESRPWDRQRPELPRRAALSGFGFGGVNAHLLLEEYLGQSFANSTTPTQMLSQSRLRGQISDEPIAIVGMASHFGPWSGLQSFQEKVLGGSTVVAPWRKTVGWDHAHEPAPPGYTIDTLNVPLARFRIPPRELEAMLPQQLVMLQVAAAALDDAEVTNPLTPNPSPQGGEGSKKIGTQPDPRCGCFIGLNLDMNTTNFHLRWNAKQQAEAKLHERYPADDDFDAISDTLVEDAEQSGRMVLDLPYPPVEARQWLNGVLDAVGPPLTADRTMGALGSIAASRVARAFHFGGPSFTLCSEESSSARAVELAMRALRQGELDRALVGGVDLAADPRVVLSNSNNATIGEGAGAVVLKRLSDAERHGDRVYALLRGAGTASGGAVDSPSTDASSYVTALLRACGDAVIDPGSIEHLESTGTPGEQRSRS